MPHSVAVFLLDAIRNAMLTHISFSAIRNYQGVVRIFLSGI